MILFSGVAAFPQDRQIPFDTAGHIPFIEQKLERKLDLFPQYDRFREARLFQSTQDSFYLIIQYESAEDFLQMMKVLDRSQVDSLRQHIASVVFQDVPELAVDQTGRTRFLVATSILGQYNAGVIPVISDMEDARAIVGVTMLSSGSMILVPIFATKRARVTVADASLSIYGQSRGIAHGVLFAYLFGGDEVSYKTILGMGMLGYFAEGIGGYAWADKTQMSGGMAAAIGALGDFGGLAGGGLSATVKPNLLMRGASAGLLVGSAAGIGSAFLLNRNEVYTRGDAVLLRGAGFLGTTIPGTVLVLTESDDQQVISGLLTAGMIGGVALGHSLAVKHDYSIGQAALVDLGSIGCGLVAAGIGYLISPDEGDVAGKISITMGTIGAIGGFAAMTQIYRDDTRQEGISDNLFIGLNPYGLLGMMPDDRLLRRKTDQDEPHWRPSLIEMRWVF